MREQYEKNNASFDALIEKGEVLADGGDISSALQCYRNALCESPLHPRAHSKIGGALIMMQRFDDAKQHLEEALVLDAQYQPALVNLGILNARQGNNSKALDMLTKAVSLAPSEILGHHNRGLVLVSLGRHKEATEAFINAGKINPTFLPSKMELASTFCARKEYEKAEAILNIALDINQENSDAWLSLSGVLHSLKKYELSATAASKALKYGANASDALINLANAYDCLNHFERAELYYEQAIEANDSNPKTYINLAAAYSHRNKYEDATRTLEHARRRWPNNANILWRLGVTYDEQGRYRRAIELFKTAIDIDNSCADYHYSLGLSMTRRGLWEQALEAFSETIDLDNNYAAAYTHRGLVYCNEFYYEDALRDFKKAIAIRPNDAYTHFCLGGAYWETARYEDAKTSLSKAIELDEKLGAAYYVLACLACAQEDVQAGITNIKMALDLDATNLSDIQSDASLDILKDTNEYRKLLNTNDVMQFVALTPSVRARLSALLRSADIVSDKTSHKQPADMTQTGTLEDCASAIIEAMLYGLSDDEDLAECAIMTRDAIGYYFSVRVLQTPLEGAIGIRLIEINEDGEEIISSIRWIQRLGKDLYRYNSFERVSFSFLEDDDELDDDDNF